MSEKFITWWIWKPLKNWQTSWLQRNWARSPLRTVKIYYRKGKKCLPPMPLAGAPVAASPAVSAAAPAAPAETPAVPQKPAGKSIKAPLVGTFYAAPSPDQPPFVQVGDTVKKGDVVLIIESMKLMNEVTSDVDGVVQEILVKNGDAVEYDQPLMILS